MFATIKFFKLNFKSIQSFNNYFVFNYKKLLHSCNIVLYCKYKVDTGSTNKLKVITMRAQLIIRMIKAINTKGLIHRIYKDSNWSGDRYEYALWNARFMISLDKNIITVMDRKRFLSFKAKTCQFKQMAKDDHSEIIWQLKQFIIDYC